VDPRRSEIRDNGVGCPLFGALFLVAVLASTAVYAAGLIALTNLIGGA
jgi:hypothetical protein